MGVKGLEGETLQEWFTKKQLSELESVMHFRDLPKNSSLLPEQDEVALLMIKAGELSVSILLHDGRELRLCVLRSGDIMCPHH